MCVWRGGGGGKPKKKQYEGINENKKSVKKAKQENQHWNSFLALISFNPVVKPKNRRHKKLDLPPYNNYS